MPLRRCIHYVDTSIWQSTKWRECGAPYQARRPAQTPLYRLIYELREEFAYCWEELFEHQYGALRPVVLKAFDAYLNCGIFAHGCARLCCEQCGHSELIAFSCKRRGLCPSCDAKRSYIFAEHMNQNVLPELPQRHIVWSIPKRLRPYFKFNRRRNSYLYRASWGAWTEYCARHLPAGKAGAVLALHTAGSKLNWHPHEHGVFLDGVITESGVFEQFKQIDTAELEPLFAGNLLQLLAGDGLLDEEALENMRSWGHSGFNVYAAEPIEPKDVAQRLFVSRYLLKCPVSLKRIKILEDPLKTTVRCFEDADHEQHFRDLSPLQFLAELQQHIPDTWEQLIHFYGIYSARTRGAQRQKTSLPAFTPIANQEEPQEKRPVSRQWAIWIKRVYEIDPLVCPKCSGRMRVLAFIFDHNEIQRITKHLGVAAWKAPPPLRSAARTVSNHSLQ